MSTVPSPVVRLREATNLVARQLEDATWNNLSSDDAKRTLDDDPDDRRNTIVRARRAVRNNPMARQAVDLLQHYVLGQGISIKAQNKSLVAKLVDEFVQHPENRATITSHDAQKEFLERLFVDGDVFYVLFADVDKGIVRVGWLDALDVVDIVPSPLNRKIPQWYKAKAPTQVYNFRTGTWEAGPGAGEFVYYRHWQNEEDPPKGLKPKSIMDGLVYQVSVDKSGLFGRPKLATAIDWLKAHREFMEDRATLNRAAAAIAWKKKRIGPTSDIAREVERLQSSLIGNPSRYEANPTRAAGATIVENAGTSMEWVDTNTGGQSADFDERKLRMMAGSGLGGIPNHYFGDEANANLAVATAMELPLLKTYEDMQQTVRQVLTDILRFMLNAANLAGRVGEDDVSDRYTDHPTTSQAVMQQPDQPGSSPTAQVVSTREAITLPYQPAPSSSVQLIPRPEDPGAMTAPEEPGPNDPVSWYIDVDFPPIVQKELFTFMQAISILAGLIPTEVIEGKKLLVELALQAFGVNDLEREMSRIFPADMVGVLVPPKPEPVELGPDGKPLPPGVHPGHFPVAESLADYRRRRLLQTVREAAGAVAGTA